MLERNRRATLRFLCNPPVIHLSGWWLKTTSPLENHHRPHGPASVIIPSCVEHPIENRLLRVLVE